MDDCRALLFLAASWQSCKHSEGTIPNSDWKGQLLSTIYSAWLTQYLGLSHGAASSLGTADIV